jgi:hypothetical protein
LVSSHYTAKPLTADIGGDDMMLTEIATGDTVMFSNVLYGWIKISSVPCCTPSTDLVALGFQKAQRTRWNKLSRGCATLSPKMALDGYRDRLVPHARI